MFECRLPQLWENSSGKYTVSILFVASPGNAAQSVAVQFEFDPAKDSINKAKHGVSFEDAKALWNAAGVEADLGLVNGEYRYVRMAPLKGVVHLAVFTFRRGSIIRLISARQATEKETEVYEQNRKK